MDDIFLSESIANCVNSAKTLEHTGKVVQAYGTTIRAVGVNAKIGHQCRIRDPESGQCLFADVVGLNNGQAILLPLGNLHGISINAEVTLLDEECMVPLGEPLLGRVLDGLGKPIDGLGEIPAAKTPMYNEAPNPMSRAPIDEIFTTGVRSIDAMLSVGVGQRIGVFAMAGGGKSTLLGMLACQSAADVIVIGLIGERGREVREFIEHTLGEKGLERSIIVVATSDRPAMERVRAAYTATAIAEGFRAEGKRVLLLMDSVTRFARALREIGLSIGEPAVRRGFPPSVFAELPQLFERAGNDDKGSITAFYTVLAEDEDGTDPIAEEVRSILDGHIVLSRTLGQEGHYPAIDVLSSVSRVFNSITGKPQQQAVTHIRKLISEYKKVEFIIQVGEYKEGADPLIDEAIAKRDRIREFLCQDYNESVTFEETSHRLLELCNAQ